MPTRVSNLHIVTNTPLPSPQALLVVMRVYFEKPRTTVGWKGLKPAVMIDARHANCSKDYRKMPAVFRDILRQRTEGAHGIIGAMLESNLVEGAQARAGSPASLTYGQSITDPCIDWATTMELVRDAAR